MVTRWTWSGKPGTQFWPGGPASGFVTVAAVIRYSTSINSMLSWRHRLVLRATVAKSCQDNV